MGMTGFSEMITVRTKWIDDGILSSEDCRQWILLGAGYDTRGFRLDLPSDGLVLEVDQPQVQQQKRNKLEWLSHHHKNPTEQDAIVDRYDPKSNSSLWISITIFWTTN
ncbi:Putative S-adenosyl-L-methionine-dependent methyltransferase [Seminavis robusta]|uniref:S-adenosyl-L-methionine-dependent methyltransferase n=1 Tax=Seminavis robusta TaxID=568900 RepID=A0A9N8DCL4_9STRA|nr:Putative S-adenosyl-L-methionine-dependent methyltransferase [Seminavis robusta]|eukprot:Sro82_g043870.1 Putative S-adenosyl-L-methionine-dependent methyltransferase (108) ;mRNA; r:60455-60778